jgi:hypothetical protein
MIQQNLNVFGWTICKVTATAGEKYGIKIGVDTPNTHLNPYTLYTKGRITGVSRTSNPTKPRVPGVANDVLPDILPADLYTFLVEQDSEWWCLDRRTNNDVVAGVTPIRVSDGDFVTFSTGDLVLICTGGGVLDGNSVSAGSAFSIDSGEPNLVASGADVYGLLFSARA